MIDTHIHVVPPRLPGVGALNKVLEEPAVIRAESVLRFPLTAAVEIPR